MDRTTDGWGSGLLGVIIFSGSLPATRVAVGDFSPLFLTSARAVIAALLAAAFLIVLRQATPGRRDLGSLAVVALGVVVGFPLLTALALQHITSAHSIVFVGLLPLTTAIFGVLRGGERPKQMFWLFSSLGAATVAGFALFNSGAGSLTGDLLMVTALALITIPGSWSAIGGPAWLGLAYVSVFSMLVGFVFWYRGLALGGIAGVGQLQLLQPFLGLALAGLLLHEPVAWTMIAATGLVILCVAGAKRFA